MYVEYHKFEDKVVRRRAPDSFGIYYLGTVANGRFVVRYVGRSDSSVKKRLLSHEYKGRFSHFAFVPTTTKREAYFLETENYYLYKDVIMNKIHPDTPVGLPIRYPGDVLGKTIKMDFQKQKFMIGDVNER